MTPARKARVDDDRFMKEHVNGLVPMLHGLFAEAPPAGLIETVREKDLETLRHTLQDNRIRVALVQALKSAVISRQAPTSEPPQAVHFEDRKTVRITLSSFEVVAALVLEALTFCDQSDDVWNGREFMVLVQKICSEGEGGKIVTLLQRVYKHTIWNKVTFWEDSLLVGLCEAHSVEAIWRRSRTGERQPGEIVIIPFLQHFVEYMLSFGIRCEQVRHCITGTLRKHVQLLGRSQEAYSRLLLHHVDAAAAKQKTDSAAAPGAGDSTAPAPRTLEENSAAPHGSAAEPASGEAVEGSATLPTDDDDDFAAVALGVQDGFGEEASADASEVWDTAGCASPVATAAPPMTAAAFGTADAAAVDLAEVSTAEVPEEATATPEADAASPEGKTPAAGAGSPEGREPADTLRKLGVEQRTTSDVFG